MTTEIKEYSETEAALAKLAQEYKGVVYDVTTAEGMGAARKGRAELRTFRTSLEKMRAYLKEDVLKRGRLIDGEAKRITAELEALETPIDEQIKKEEKRVEDLRLAKVREEQARIAEAERLAKEAEERRMATERAEIARQQEELRKAEAARLAAEAESRRRIEEGQREARLKLEADERAARIARQAEEDRIRAERKAEQDKLDAERAELDRQRRETEERERKLRQAEEERQRTLRREQEEKEREAREQKEAEERDARRVIAHKEDGRAMLAEFCAVYGDIKEFEPIIAQINKFLKAKP